MGLYYVLVRELFEESTAGTSLALFGTVAFVGSLIGPAVGSWLIDAVDWQPTFAVYLLASAAAVGLVLSVPEQARGGEEYASEVLALPVTSLFRFLRHRLSRLVFFSRRSRLWRRLSQNLIEAERAVAVSEALRRLTVFER